MILLYVVLGMKGVDAKAPEGRPPEFRSSGIMQAPRSVRPAHASLKPASVWKPTGAPPHVCLCQVLIPRTPGVLIIQVLS